MNTKSSSQIAPNLRFIRIKNVIWLSLPCYWLQVFDSLKDYGIRNYFQDVTLSSVTELRKPDPLIFDVALHQLQSTAAESVYVGDTVSRDIIGSKRAGFAKAIQIGSQLTREKDAGICREFEPDYIVSDIYDVLPILKELTEK